MHANLASSGKRHLYLREPTEQLRFVRSSHAAVQCGGVQPFGGVVGNSALLIKPAHFQRQPRSEPLRPVFSATHRVVLSVIGLYLRHASHLWGENKKGTNRIFACVVRAFVLSDLVIQFGPGVRIQTRPNSLPSGQLSVVGDSAWPYFFGEILS